jgi:hypothetical protein
MTEVPSIVRSAVWSQFGGSLDALAAAITACPEELWGRDGDERAFWYLAFHTLFWCDLYPHGSARHCTFAWGSLSYLELLLYVMRHTQHHGGQLALLRERGDIGTPPVKGAGGAFAPDTRHGGGGHHRPPIIFRP